MARVRRRDRSERENVAAHTLSIDRHRGADTTASPTDCSSVYCPDASALADSPSRHIAAYRAGSPPRRLSRGRTQDRGSFYSTGLPS